MGPNHADWGRGTLALETCCPLPSPVSRAPWMFKLSICPAKTVWAIFLAWIKVIHILVKVGSSFLSAPFCYILAACPL